MDSEFLALSIVFILIGLTGIALFNGPMNAAGDSCYCIIPSPEPGAAQGTSSIFLALGFLFFPMGLMKGGLPSLRRGLVVVSPAQVQPARTYNPLPLSSGALFAVGILLVIIGFDAVLVPAYLVLRSVPIMAGGAVITVLGLFAVFLGSKMPRSS